ncbi:sodium/potassium-transporting ATPase subunit alpha-like isoform X2 [Tribolium madens]|uniref:sodium/potassium-transporting ATPase subunit alpha-like isoform X2 n=1 Tax=Tribolium madens TaxID=41895 RepID=UPI001CF75303|nr:sodium/potassium-transporting ATPase subunit alpha-like isoform X2 [Tribolium madens]
MPILYKQKGRLSAKEQSAARLENFRKEVSTDCHTIPLEELCNRFDTDPVAGLTPAKAKEVLLLTGPNSLTPSKKKSQIIKYIETLFHGFSALLWIGALLCYISVLIQYLHSDKRKMDMDNVVLGAVLIVVVIATGSFTYYQERKSQTIMDSFARMVPAKATVIRDSTPVTIESRDVVLGDLVDLKFGDRVPADVRIIQCQSLKVDNSPITGESEPQSRSTTSSEDNFLESRNVAFFSTNVVEGTGRGIVIACGDQTVMGRIAGLTARLQPNKTPMAKEFERFMRIISIWAITLGVVLGVTCLILGHSVIKTLLFSIGMIVANVPEGLLATVIVCLTVTAKRMASQNCLIKKLESVETLGCTSVICSDKTGTLTQNRMTVCHVWYNGKVMEIDFNNLRKIPKPPELGFRNLIRCATLCNRAEFVSSDDNKPILQRQVRGDASEGAILKFVEVLNILGKNFKNSNPKLIEIPFSSTTKYQISVHALENKKCLVAMKGAPEVVLERCSSIFHRNETKEMTPDLLQQCNSACLEFAEMGQRVLGFCDLQLDDSYNPNSKFTVDPANFPQRGLRFLGLIAMIDPPRPQVPDAINRCKTAGIKIAMVTGDHPITAKAIAIKVGIITEGLIHQFTTAQAVRNFKTRYSDPGAVVVHGLVLKELLQEELDDLLFDHPEIVFARTSPTQKLQIVEGYQRLGEIVAVTGDGVNDAPALKKADTGIAMGIAGTEVSQQAADIILMDDNFASIIIGIEEASNVPEILPFLAYAFLGIPLPLGVVAILCIDLLTDMMPAISLAYEKAETDIMLRPPRNPLRDRLVNRKLYFLAYGNLGMLEALGAFLVYFLIMAEFGFMPARLLNIRDDWESYRKLNDSYGRPWTHSQRKVVQNTCSTGVMMSVVVTQWTNLVACKTRVNSILVQGMGNMVLNVSLLVETLLTAILSYTPYMYYLSFYPLSWWWWIYALPFSILLLLYDEYRKWHIRKYPKGWYQRETFY